METLRVVVTGAGGRLGRALLRAGERPGLAVTGLAHARVDISSRAALWRELSVLRPHWVINAAGFTDVAGAQAPEVRHDVWRANAQAPAVLGEVCRALGAGVLHVSTDYVLGGVGEALLMENDAPRPRGVYAESKAEGEEALRRSGAAGAVVRAGWLHSGERDFFAKIVDRAIAGEPLAVTHAQVGKPASFDAFARWIMEGVALGPAAGFEVLHYVEAGPYVSRYDAARFALETLLEEDEARRSTWEMALKRLRATETLAAEQPANCRLARQARSRFYRAPDAYWPDGVKQTLAVILRERFGEAPSGDAEGTR